jgi:NAD(P)-dependent dehydrogenase (short-subunit alcohol dehydrogenase family)
MLKVDLAGRTVLVTGGGSVPGRGMGRAICLGFAGSGANVVVVDIDESTAAATADAIRAAGGNAIAVRADISDTEQVDRTVAAAEREYGTVDVLVNHAGIGNMTSLVDTDDEWWARCLGVTLTGPFLTSRRILPQMLEAGRGVILNTISICGIVGGRAGAAYTAAKHGLVGLTRNTAATYGDRGIRCIGICPGGVHGEGDERRWDSSLHTVVTAATPRPELWPSLERGLALNPRSGRPQEIADVVVFMASDHASFVNGAILPVDAGWTAI